MKYRPEIDGLRALAVLPVILFHAGFKAFSGGYVGVDVFFVISGFLITTIILNDLVKERFSLLVFYEKRARRILPALLTVILSITPFALFYLTPEDFQSFGESVLSANLFLSNFFFASEVDYFATKAELKPLLHTWSLAVEEQYYIFFPLMLISIWSINRKLLFISILGTFILSLTLAVGNYGIFQNEALSFFLLPTRAWEILLGSLCSLFVLHNKKQFSTLVNQAFSALGLMLIVYSIFYFDESMPTPGLYTLAPTLGAALILICARKQTLVNSLLSFKIFVWCGLISYSSYLWHQPIFAFARYITFNRTTFLIQLLCIVLTIFLAFITWYFVETPIRKSKDENKFIIKNILIVSISLSVFGLSAIIFEGFQFRYSGPQVKVYRDGLRNHKVLRSTAYDRFRCFFDQTQKATQLIDFDCISKSKQNKIILFGDSEAAHYMDGFKEYLINSDMLLNLFTGASCRAIDFSKNGRRCKLFYSIFNSELSSKINEGDIVIVSSNWFNVYRKITEVEFKNSLRSLLKEIKKAGAKPFLILNTPDFSWHPYKYLVRTRSAIKPNMFLPAQIFSKSNTAIQSVAVEENVDFFDPSTVLCNGSSECQFIRNDEYLFYDAGHLSKKGSLFLVKEITKHDAFNDIF